MPEKNVNLNFFQLNPIDESVDADEYKKEIKAIAEMFNSPPTKFAQINLTEFHVNLYGNIEKQGDYFLGTLIKNQISSIPPSYDESTSTLAPLPLADHQGIAFSTSFLYDPSVRIVMIESVQNGIGIHLLCSFLNRNFKIPRIEPSIVINPSKLQEFLSMTVVSKFQVRIAKLQSGTIFSTKKNTALGKIIHSADETNTDYVDYALTARRSSTLKKSRILMLLKSFLKYEDTQEVQKLVVTGKENEDAESDTINFIEQKLRDYITVERHRLISSFEINDRYEKLLEVYHNHKPSLNVYKIKAR